ncbi:unnamed protein product [Ceutorhynchus assimilis]|uniref:Juvenile hormone binding protein n=1 Tax=Ceutorhynchus assimilis TaxID=467358 RepID=A0A9N9MJR1_9CUCU|nr:unnamed protein product [Ceutorhynchus assimilis]
MKLFLALVALVGFASSSETDDLEKCKLFLECCHQAMDGGIPSIPIPNHNPLKISDVLYNGSKLLTEYSFGITDNTLYNLIDFNITTLTATSYENPGRVAFDYNVYWHKLNFTGNFEVNISNLLLNQHFQGTYNIVMREINWYGIFNLTKPGQEGIEENLDGFTLHSTTESVDVTLTGLNSVIDFSIESALELGIYNIMNNFPASAAEFLRTKRFNGFWLANPYKIDQVIQHCRQ